MYIFNEKATRHSANRIWNTKFRRIDNITVHPVTVQWRPEMSRNAAAISSSPGPSSASVSICDTRSMTRKPTKYDHERNRADSNQKTGVKTWLAGPKKHWRRFLQRPTSPGKRRCYLILFSTNSDVRLPYYARIHYRRTRPRQVTWPTTAHSSQFTVSTNNTISLQTLNIRQFNYALYKSLKKNWFHTEWLIKLEKAKLFCLKLHGWCLSTKCTMMQ